MTESDLVKELLRYYGLLGTDVQKDRELRNMKLQAETPGPYQKAYLEAVNTLKGK